VIGPMSAMQISSLAVTNRPLWINVQEGYLEKITFNAKVHFWPVNAKSIALFLIEFEGTPEQEKLTEVGITSSAVGAYVYLNSPELSGDLQQTIVLPPTKVKRIGIQLWNTQEPLLLVNLAIVAFGATVSSEYSLSSDAVVNGFNEFKAEIRPELLALSLMAQENSCNAHCHAICRNWYETMDDVARRHGTDDAGRVNGVLSLEDGTTIPVSLFNGTPAMLRIPESHPNYLEKIGDKARNMIRKAQRQGYVYKKVDPNDHLDEVLAIRISDPERQGKPIPEYYKVRPTQMIDAPFSNGCERHGEDFFGVFKDGRLVAYTTIFFYGELGQVNHILGHVDHLQEGVMNLLVSEMVKEIILTRPWVRAINYLYPHASKANSGIGLFKRSIGFLPERILVSNRTADLSQYNVHPIADTSALVPQITSEKKAVRASTTKAAKVAAAEAEFVPQGKVRNREKAIELALRHLNTNHQQQEVVRCASPSRLAERELDQSSAYTVVFDDIRFEQFTDFLSSGLKNLRKTVPKESFLLLDFKRKPDIKHVIKTTGIAGLIPRFFHTEGRRVNQGLLDYLSKRFKSLDLSMGDIKTGFKGSDYVVAGMIDIEGQSLYRNFDSLLILRKIR